MMRFDLPVIKALANMRGSLIWVTFQMHQPAGEAYFHIRSIAHARRTRRPPLSSRKRQHLARVKCADVCATHQREKSFESRDYICHLPAMVKRHNK